MQLDHYSTKFKNQIFPIVLICEDVTNAANIGSLFRAADTFGVKELVFCGTHIPMGRKMTKTSRATEKFVKYSVADNALDVVNELKTKDYKIISLEITSKSEALEDFKFPKNASIALVIGNENFGVSEGVLNRSDAVIHINMYGQNSSMNVVQATSVILYEITKQLKLS